MKRSESFLKTKFLFDFLGQVSYFHRDFWRPSQDELHREYAFFQSHFFPQYAFFVKTKNSRLSYHETRK